MKHIFWLLLSLACLAWYLFVTGYIAFRGALDIRKMLKNIAALHEKKQDR